MTLPSMTPHHPVRPAQQRRPPQQRIAGMLAACGLALLAACGPGVGGTGTGTTAAQALAAFGASAQPLCAGALAQPLQCPASADGAGAPAAAPQPRLFADAAAAPRALARFADDGVELELACQRLRFTGSWGAVAGQPARFYGQVQPAGGGELRLATLEAAAAGSGIRVTLTDAAGTLLAAPLLLQPVPTPAPVAACPG